jgi:hypothetical protein
MRAARGIRSIRLLAAQILIGGDELSFRDFQQLTVAQLGPAHFEGGRHGMAGERPAQRDGRSLV